MATSATKRVAEIKMSPGVTFGQVAGYLFNVSRMPMSKSAQHDRGDDDGLVRGFVACPFVIRNGGDWREVKGDHQ